MSLKNFHRLFIILAFICFAFMARWAAGRNAAMRVTPWAQYVSVIGMTLLIPYFVWTITKFR